VVTDEGTDMGLLTRRRIQLIAAFALLTASGLALGFSNRFGASPPQSTDSAGVYKNRCSRCHGVDGKPKRDTIPDFTDAKWQSSRKDEDLKQSISDGKGEMPAYGQILDETQINGLITYIRSLAKPGQ